MGWKFRQTSKSKEIASQAFKRNHGGKQEHAGVTLVVVEHRTAGSEDGAEKQGVWESALVSSVEC